jgi:hypothetical protein
VVGKCDNLERALSLRNVLHLPTTQCACEDFWNFAKQRNGGGSREQDQSGGTLTRYLTLIEVANHSQNGRPAGFDARAF